jgi:uncharacterized repeat protein (TIGR01451 family)
MSQAEREAAFDFGRDAGQPVVAQGFVNGLFTSSHVDLQTPASTAMTPAPPPRTAADSAGVQVVGPASTGRPLVGTTFVYTFQVKNSGSLPAPGVTLSDDLPANLTYLGAGTSAGLHVGRGHRQLQPGRPGGRSTSEGPGGRLGGSRGCGRQRRDRRAHQRRQQAIQQLGRRERRGAVNRRRLPARHRSGPPGSRGQRPQLPGGRRASADRARSGGRKDARVLADEAQPLQANTLQVEVERRLVGRVDQLHQALVAGPEPLQDVQAVSGIHDRVIA